MASVVLTIDRKVGRTNKIMPRLCRPILLVNVDDMEANGLSANEPVFVFDVSKTQSRVKASSRRKRRGHSPERHSAASRPSNESTIDESPLINADNNNSVGKSTDRSSIYTPLLFASVWPSNTVKQGQVRLNSFAIKALEHQHSVSPMAAKSDLATQHTSQSTADTRTATINKLRLERMPADPSAIPAATSLSIRLRDCPDVRPGQTLQSYVRETLREMGAGTQGVYSLVMVGQAFSFVYGGIQRRGVIQSAVTEHAKAPMSVVKLVSTTAIRIRTDRPTTGPALAAKVTPRVGGMASELRKIREMLHFPLHAPELFLRHGMTPPRGLLLHGPPGTGKTLIARACAAHLHARLVCLNGADIVGKYVGESEARLRQVFHSATNGAGGAPTATILFIDEVDTLCPMRRAGSVASDHEKRIVSALLHCLDALNRASPPAKVVVLAATNRPSAVHAALRRPGRLDREVEVGVPDRAGRRDILHVILESMGQLQRDAGAIAAKHSGSLDMSTIDQVATSAHGCVGADLYSMCRQAAVSALSRCVRQWSSEHPGGGKSATGPRFRILAADLLHAAARTRPSALRSLLVEVPKVRWTDIGGQTTAKQRLREAVEWPLKHPEAFARMRIRPPKGVLLYGPPGCSKTMMAKALATESTMNFIAIKGPELFRKWVGESEQAVAELFQKARATAPTVVFFDEVDAISVARGAGNGESSSSVADRVLSQLLHEIDGVQPLVQVVVVAATNRPDIIDAALLRPGRLDNLVYVAPPTLEARKAIIRIHLRHTPVAAGSVSASSVGSICVPPSALVDHLAERTEGFSGAEIASLCREAALVAMEHAEAGPQTASCVEDQHFERALERVQPQITSQMLRFYEKFAQTGLKGRK